LALAERNSLVLGVLYVVFCVILCIPLFCLVPLIGYSPIPDKVLWIALLCYGLPGVLYITFAGRISEQKKWAVVAALVVAGITGGFLVVACVGAALGAFWASASGLVLDLVGFFFLGVYCVVLLAATVLLLVNLAQSIKAIDTLAHSAAGSEAFKPQ
jgi:hypothetical protein